jgi:uncharacterized protein (AIM24 family)
LTTAPPIYVCRYCRQPSDASGTSCPNCGAAIDLRAVVSDSGWQEQPPIRDMARIQFGSSTAQIEGTYVPVVDFNLQPPSWIYFSHHTLLWADKAVQMQAMPIAGGWKRMRAGLPLVMMQASGPGHIALSDDHPGEVVAVPLAPGQGIHVLEHRFLCATDGVKYDWQQAGIWFTTGTGDDTEYHYPAGYNVDVFHAPQQPGLLLLHSPGNSFIRDLHPGESICIQPSALLYKDLTVSMNLHLEYPNVGGGMFWSRSYEYRQVWLRLMGPGRVAVQSIFGRPEGSEIITGVAPGTTRHRW